MGVSHCSLLSLTLCLNIWRDKILFDLFIKVDKLFGPLIFPHEWKYISHIPIKTPGGILIGILSKLQINLKKIFILKLDIPKKRGIYSILFSLP